MSDWNDEEVVAQLQSALETDPAPLVRAEAALSLGVEARRIGACPEIVDALLRALQDQRGAPRRAAALALRDHMDQAVATQLVQVLREAPELWREVATALGGLGARLVVKDLIGILANASNTRSRLGAARALAFRHDAAGDSTDSAGHRDLVVVGRGDDDPLHAYEDADGVRHPLY